MKHGLSLLLCVVLILGWFQLPSRAAAEGNSSATTTGFGGAVSAATPEAAEAGREILESGGNAIDAAVAISLVLAVTEPAGSGLGGQSSFIVHPHKGRPFAINGTSFSPRATPRDAKSENITGHKATTVPSTLRVLEYAWRRFGSGRLTWAQLLAPAIRYAENGFRVGSFRHRSLIREADRLRANPSAAKLFLNPDGTAPELNSVFKQPVLAETLKRLAHDGANDFYRGKIAGEIAADMKANGGWITLEDLNNVPPPQVLPALKGTYRGWEVYTLPPPAGGWAVLQILNILEHAPAGALVSGSPHRPIWIAEALRIAHKNRRADPLADYRSAREVLRDKIGKTRAKQLAATFELPGSGETTHFSVVDKQGMAVGVTQSLNNYFGAKVASPGLGFLYNDYMREFEIGRPNHPFALRPQAPPYSSMSATVISRRGEVGMVLGSPGSSRIISTVAQVISHWVDNAQAIEAAVAAPRLHVVPDNSLYVEANSLSESLLAELKRRGFRMVEPNFGLTQGGLDPYFGGVHAIAKESSGWRGVADPRRDGVVSYAAARAIP